MPDKFTKLIIVFISLFMQILFMNVCKHSLIVLFSSFLTLAIIFLTLQINNKKQTAYIINENNIYELIHDLKTPVTAGLQITDLFLNEKFGEINSLQKEILIQMHNSSQYVFSLINNISTICAYEHDNINWNYEIFDINKIIKTCIQDLKYIAMDKRCSILFDYSDEEIFVFASKLQISRVLYNLITNAVNYSYPDRIITVITTIKEDKCYFEVNSFGDKLSNENINNIFEKYKSLKKTGNGLGLYICDLILKQHRCKMTVISNNKTGNCFKFNLKLSSKIPANNINI
ncbi:HAMP domain-containing histidine kinase [bacterium]|nr:HAMP domain-containing histidine kinase [bacterium]